MKSSAYSLLSVVLAVVLVPFLNAQKPPASSAAAPSQPGFATDAPDSCEHLFAIHSGNNSIAYCVTDNGNITAIDTPIGHTMLGAGGEGYGLCQESPIVEYHDYAVSNSGNWNAPQILSLTGSAIKISRTTSDGNWTLVQTISKVGATASIKVVMALTNNQSVDKVAYLLRFADIDPNGDQGSSTTVGASFESAWGWDDTQNTFHYGLQLLNSGKSPFSYQQGFVFERNSGPNACDFAAGSDSGGVIGGLGGSVSYTYAGVVPALQTLTVTMNYRGT